MLWLALDALAKQNGKWSPRAKRISNQEAILKETSSIARTASSSSSSLLPSGLVFVKENYRLDFAVGKNTTRVYVDGIPKERTRPKGHHHHSQSGRDDDDTNSNNSNDDIMATLKPSSEMEKAWQLFNQNMSDEEFINTLVEEFPELDNVWVKHVLRCTHRDSRFIEFLTCHDGRLLDERFGNRRQPLENSQDLLAIWVGGMGWLFCLTGLLP